MLVTPGRVVDSAAIQSVTVERPIYVVDGQQHFIDFNECCRNWVNYVKTPPDYATTNLDVTQTRTVAIRAASTKLPTIDFMTTPPTRFTFERVQRGRYWFHRENLVVADFTALQRQIQDAGWTTFDAS